jgi:fatty acid desaturase
VQDAQQRLQPGSAGAGLRGVALTATQRAVEIARPFLLLLLYVALAACGHLRLALPVALATCFAAFVLMHDALHESLGLSRRAHGIVLALSGQMLLKSGHALKATHLRHHGKCLGVDDPEGAPARWSLRRVLFEGPFHMLALRREALRIAPRTRAVQLVETGFTGAILALAVVMYVHWRTTVGLVYWAVAAAVSAAMPLWAAYIPHRLAPKAPAIRAAARFAQLWTPVLSSFAYHHVHHAHPKVPTALLPQIARAVGNDPMTAQAHAHAHAHDG